MIFSIAMGFSPFPFSRADRPLFGPVRVTGHGHGPFPLLTLSRQNPSPFLGRLLVDLHRRGIYDDAVGIRGELGREQLVLDVLQNQVPRPSQGIPEASSPGAIVPEDGPRLDRPQGELAALGKSIETIDAAARVGPPVRIDEAEERFHEPRRSDSVSRMLEGHVCILQKIAIDGHGRAPALVAGWGGTGW